MLPRSAQSLAHYDTEQLRAFLAHHELPRDPGAAFGNTRWASGCRATHWRSWHTNHAAAADAIILRPLGMTMSGTVHRSPGVISFPVATG
jgi:hypothetical protein